MIYSIDAIAQLTGISAFTLRNWEKRYAFLKPKRLGNGFRAYDDAHVELLRKVTALLSHGARIGDLAESIRKGKALPEIHAPKLAPEVEARVKLLFEFLTAFDIKAAEDVHADFETTFDPLQMLDLVYAPLLARAGREWNAGTSSTAQEQFATVFIRLHLAKLLSGKHPSEAKGKNSARKVICAAASDSYQDGSLMLLAAHLKLKGWSTYYLGHGLPVEEVHAAAKLIQPHVVCMSFTDPQGIHSSIPFLSRFDCRVCLGGFGALTFDSEELLPPHLTLFKSTGRLAAEAIEAILE